MRITGGVYRGRTLRMPPGDVRPTMDRMRESFFAMLGPLDGIRFLDLFGGSGVVAVEAASRGAPEVVTVERDRRNAGVVRENIRLAEGAVSVLFQPAERYVMTAKEAFDIIYIDPPFEYRHSADLLNRIGRSKLLHASTLVLIHHPGVDLGEPAHMVLEQRKRYGKSHLDIFRASFAQERMK